MSMTDPTSYTPAADATILVVDDSPLDRRVVGWVLEKHGGWSVEYAGDGARALELIARNPPRLVLTDLQMPVLDGLALVEQVRTRHPQIPVVLMTGHGSEEISAAALRAGAASYVEKRSLAVDLVSVLEQVLGASHADGPRNRTNDYLTRAASCHVLPTDPLLVGPLVGALQEPLLAMGVCDPTDVTRVGIALEEALLNALYHGNLEVGSELKRDDDRAFYRLAAERRGQAPYRDRRIRVLARVRRERAVYRITDDGPGFNVAALTDTADPSRPSGRGITLMRTFMDRVTFNAVGNEVTMVKLRNAARKVQSGSVASS
ncbi:response regulator [Fimbriiglobus ruber]|uniref:Response regulator receiver:CheW-like protein:ATP-binding region, ATPase-like n=1 Tax=Fimbriiglobus ruber TaxID=1908690 RepID=A0A225DKC3_9BACT|nr:response regulator [Fimbriiglobus ruber]OWK36825.1 Response regulator receiver:CheW-like protein:ATP-binding region, ATPase-like [Fimbriiglobus ruber]